MRILRVVRVWNFAAVILLLVYLSWRLLRAADYRELAQRVGYNGPQRTFPIAHFRERAPTGARARDVWFRMTGYDKVEYFLVPIVGTKDSVLVQQFCYPMRLEHLEVEIEYKGGVVSDIEVSGEKRAEARTITPYEAFARLGWKPHDK